jgi:undecaprenyl diphosphate synthase
MSPAHVAIIMDGNGRWAERRGLPRTEGHRRGADAARRVVRAAAERGIGVLTLHCFSTHNWARPRAEVAALMALLRDFLVGERAELVRSGVRVRAIGELSRLPAPVREALESLRAETATGRRLTLCLALSHGGRASLIEAARTLAAAALAGTIDPSRLDSPSFAAALPTAGLPDVDLVIRTSGEQRLSDFLPWETAHAELYFTDVCWPDFDAAALDRALAWFAGRQRRYGRTERQLDGEEVLP